MKKGQPVIFVLPNDVHEMLMKMSKSREKDKKDPFEDILIDLIRKKYEEFLVLEEGKKDCSIRNGQTKGVISCIKDGITNSDPDGEN